MKYLENKISIASKKIVSLFILAFVFSFANAQILDPVDFSTSTEKISDTDYYLVVTATIDEGWHLYAQYIPEDGPIPTTITLENNSNDFQLIGKPLEDKGHTSFDKIFEMNIKYFENTATFKQRIRLLTNDKIDINGEVEFMACDDGQCTPPSFKDLNFSLQGKAGVLATDTEIEKIIKENSITEKKK